MSFNVADEPLVLITARSFGTGRADPDEILRRAGLRTVRGDPKHDLDALAPHLAVASGWIAGTAPICEEHLARAPFLRLIARYGVGTDSVDLGAASRRSVVVTNTPGANAAAVADLAIGLMLAVLRRIVDADTVVRAGEQRPFLGRELGMCTVGIIGYGTIGRLVRARLAGFGSTVVAHDPYQVAADVPLLELSDLARIADVVTLHAPGANRPIVDTDFVSTLQPGGVIVNTARASLVDERAVLEALRSGHLAGFATDVLEPHSSELLRAPNVVATPHIGGHTTEAIDRMGLEAAAACVRFLVEGEAPRSVVTSQAQL